MNKATFQGTGVALVTPFNKHQEVDKEALGRLVDHVIDGGVDYLVALGTTGETATLDKEEKEMVVSLILERNAGRVPVVRGIGGNNTREIVKELESLNREGLSGILSVSPYYNKPTQEGIFRHYQAISEASALPVILYNVPGRTSSNILPSTTLRIARECANVVAVKEASGNLEQMMQIIADKPEGFELISGDDALTLPIIASGGTGVISVVANVFPKQFSSMVNAAMKGDFATARKFHYQLLHVTGLLFSEGNPGGAKAALAELGVCENAMRLPLWQVSEQTNKSIVEEVKRLAGVKA